MEDQMIEKPTGHWASMLLPLLCFITLVAFWEICTKVLSLSSQGTAWAGCRMERSGGTDPQWRLAASYGRQSLSCDDRFLSGRHLRYPLGHLAWTLGKRQASAQSAGQFFTPHLAPGLDTFGHALVRHWPINRPFFLIFLSSFFPMVVFTTVAVQRIDPVYFQVAANFNFSATDRIVKIIIPAIVPAVVTALRLTVTIAWLVVVAAEMIAVQSGLGYLILDSRNALRMDYVLDGMLVIGFIGLLLDWIVRQLGKIESAQWDGQAD